MNVQTVQFGGQSVYLSEHWTYSTGRIVTLKCSCVLLGMLFKSLFSSSAREGLVSCQGWPEFSGLFLPWVCVNLDISSNVFMLWSSWATLCNKLSGDLASWTVQDEFREKGWSRTSWPTRSSSLVKQPWSPARRAIQTDGSHGSLRFPSLLTCLPLLPLLASLLSYLIVSGKRR